MYMMNTVQLQLLCMIVVGHINEVDSMMLVERKSLHLHLQDCSTSSTLGVYAIATASRF